MGLPPGWQARRFLLKTGLLLPRLSSPPLLWLPSHSEKAPLLLWGQASGFWPIALFIPKSTSC